MKAAKQILVSACALLVLCVLIRFTLFRSFTDHIPLRGISNTEQTGLPQFNSGNEGVLRLEITGRRGDYVNVKLQPLNKGNTDIYIADSE